MSAIQHILPIMAVALAGVASAVQPSDHFGRLPLSFAAGESSDSFVARGPGYQWLVTPTTAVLATPEHQVRLQWAGANPAAGATGTDRLPGVANYYLGNDPSQWRVGVPLFERVRYANVYPGVDLVYYGNQRELQHDFIVHPGACPDQIRLATTGRFHIAADGSLVTGTIL